MNSLDTENTKKDYIQKSAKGQKIIKKFEVLVEKISKETNPVKLIMLKFKLNQLQVAIQEAIDLEQSKEEYAFRKDDLYKTRKQKTNVTIQDIAKLTYQKRILDNKLRAYEEYDIQSPYFLYDKSIITSQGGMENILKQLRSDGSIESQETVDKIEEMMEVHRQLDEVEEKRKMAREDVHTIEKDYTKSLVKTDIENMAMIIDSKANIFRKFGNWFRSGMKVLAETIETRRDMKKSVKELKREKKERDEEAIANRDQSVALAEKAYKKEMDRIIQQEEILMAQKREAAERYKRSMDVAQRTYENSTTYNDSYSKSQQDVLKTAQRQNRAKVYRDVLKEMTGGITPMAGASEGQEQDNSKVHEKRDDSQISM